MIDYANQKMINKKGIMILYGLSDYQAGKIIRQAKIILISEGYEYYNNRRIARVPHEIVKQILAVTKSE